MSTSGPKKAGAKTSAVELEGFSARALAALKKMPEEDRAEILDALPETPTEMAAVIAGSPLSAELMSPKLTHLIDRLDAALADLPGDRKLHGALAHSAALRQQLRDAMELPDWREATAQAFEGMKEVLQNEGVTREQIERLVTELEVLQDLHGARDLDQVSDPRVREGLALLGDPDLRALLVQASRDLASVMFGEVRAEAEREHLID